VFDVCAGLVIVDESNIVRLVHYTAQEYLQHHRTNLFPNAEMHITKALLTYMSFSAFEDGPCKTTESFRDRAQCYSLYEYAALNWGHHARENASPCDEVVEFLKSPGPHIQASVQAMDLDLSGYFSGPQSRTTGLHLAAHFGLKQVVAILLQDSSVDSVNGEGDTPLQLAAKQGHIATMRLLVDHGAMIDASDGHGRTALVRTAEYDDQIEPEQVVQLLLERGANVGAADGLGCTPLHYAARRQRLGTAKLLLEKRANPNVTDERGYTPLYEAFKTAIETGSEQTVQLLLHYRAGISDEDGPRLLRIASGKAQDQVVHRLLELGVKADAVDDEGKTPLHYLLSKFWAPSDIDLNDVEGRLRRIVAGLLARSPLMINIQDQYGRTPLHIEDWFYRRHHGIYVMRARILVESGAKLDVKDKHELIPLRIMAATVKTEAELGCILETAATQGNGSFTNNALVAALRSALTNGNAGNAVSLFRRISMSELDFGEARLMLRFCFELRLEDKFDSDISVLTRSHPGIMSITDEFGWQLEDLQYHSSTTAASPAAADSRIDSFATRLLIPTRLVLPHGWPRFQGLRLNKLSFSCSLRGISRESSF
jgi:ankyrin repeat protein